MIKIALMVTTSMLIIHTAAVKLSMVNSKIAANYKAQVKLFNQLDGDLTLAAVRFWQHTDMNSNGLPDAQEVHGGATVSYANIIITKDPSDPHVAHVVAGGRLLLSINNFPGSYVAGQASGQADPLIKGWVHK